MDTYADDLAELTKKLDLKDAVHVGHSTGGGEVVRFIGRQWHQARRKGRVDRRCFAADAEGAGKSQRFAAGGLRWYPQRRPSRSFSILQRSLAALLRIQSARCEDFRGVRESFWLQGMLVGFPAAYFCIKAFSETDLTEDLKKIDVPTLILHGDDDQIVPIEASAYLSSKLVQKSQLIVYKARRMECARHSRTGLTTTC